MERGLILLVAALVVYVAPGVRGTSHLSFSNNTQVNVTRHGCGVTKLCVETPNDCDPTGKSNCLFVSVVASPPVAPNGSELSIGLRGDSTGYIALGLTVNPSEGTTMLFLCAQNRSDQGKFFFRTMQRDNTDKILTSSERRVTEIRGMVNASVIKCEFKVPNVNASNTRSSHVTTFSVLLGKGTFDGKVFGPFEILKERGPLNLADVTSNGSGAVRPHAVLLMLSVLILSVLQRA